MNENSLIKPLLEQVRQRIEPNGVVLRMSDMVTHGIPDFTTTQSQSTIWWEVKWATPRIKSPGIQQLTARRLAKYGRCWFIVYQKIVGVGFFTGIVHPNAIKEDGTFDWYHHVAGIDHGAIVDFIEMSHLP